MKDINIGLVGAGVVGGGVVKMLSQKAVYFRESLGLPLVLKRIADKAANRFTELPVGTAVCTENADDILNDKDIQIVIELVGGTTFARSPSPLRSQREST